MRLFALKLFDGANVPKDSELYNDKLPDLQVMSKVDKEKKKDYSAMKLNF